MNDTTHTSVDFSNVTFADFGKLSIAQKMGFLICLPIALPIFVLVKVFSFVGINSNEDHAEASSTVGPESGAAVSAVFGALAEAASETNEEQYRPREVGDDQWCNDLISYGEEVASMRAATD